MTPIQIVLLVAIVLIIIKIFQKYRAAQIGMREFFLWTTFWLFVSVLVIFPDSTQAVANMVGIGRGADLVFYLAILVLFSGLFFILVRLERIERDITKIVRQLALKKKGSKEVAKK